MAVRALGIGNPFSDKVLHLLRSNDLSKSLEKGQNTVTFEKSKVEAVWKDMCEKEGKSESDFELSLGGSCTNVMIALSNIMSCLTEHSSCALLGMAGYDKKEEFEQKLQDLGVKSLLVKGASENGVVTSFVTPDKERTMHAFFGASLELSKDKISPQHFENISHVHLEGYLAYFEGVLEHSLALAKEQKATLSLDLACIDVIKNCKQRLQDCADKVDIIFGNFQEMQTYTGETEVESIFRHFKKEQIVVITNGSKGGWVKAKDSDHILPFEATVVAEALTCDTTGAGDFFTAGFLAGLLAKKDIQLAIKLASLVASHVIQQDGTELTKHKWQEIKQQITVLTASS